MNQQDYHRRSTASGSAVPPPRVKRAKGGTVPIVGYGAVFYREGVPGTEYDLTLDGSIVERIEPGAFDRVLRERQNTAGLLNHDQNFILGRVGSGTMRLSVDSIGLRYEIDADPENPFAAHAISAIRRGDVSGSSFGFIVSGVRWEELPDGRVIRYIEEVSHLFDVGPVTYPAYESTTSSVGGEMDRKRKIDRDRVSVRLRLLELDDMMSKA